MLALFSNVSSKFDFSKYLGKLNIDNGALKLQYRFTAPILMVASILVTAQQFIGERISCIQSAKAIPENVLNTYCFFVGTTTWDNDTSNFPHRGIGPEKEDVSATRHLYYQWVAYYLFFLALLFYSSHFLWKGLEKRRLGQITAGIEHLKFSLVDYPVGTIPSKGEKQEKVDTLAHILWSRIKNDVNDDWTRKLIFVEFYAFAIVLFIFFLTDIFLGGKGAFVHMTVDSAFRTFPTETSCIFYKYGPSGTIQRHDAFCILATNIVNVYIFLIFYAWMLMLIIMSSLALIWRFIGFFLYRNDWFNRITPFNHINSLVDEDARKTVFKTLSYFDWVFLNYVSENSDGMTYREVFKSLSNIIKNDYTDLPDEQTPFAKDLND